MAEQALSNLETAGIERPVDEQGQAQKILGVADSGYFSGLAVAEIRGLGD